MGDDGGAVLLEHLPAADVVEMGVAVDHVFHRLAEASFQLASEPSGGRGLDGIREDDPVSRLEEQGAVLAAPAADLEAVEVVAHLHDRVPLIRVRLGMGIGADGSTCPLGLGLHPFELARRGDRAARQPRQGRGTSGGQSQRVPARNMVHLFCSLPVEGPRAGGLGAGLVGQSGVGPGPGQSRTSHRCPIRRPHPAAQREISAARTAPIRRLYHDRRRDGAWQGPLRRRDSRIDRREGHASRADDVKDMGHAQQSSLARTTTDSPARGVSVRCTCRHGKHLEIRRFRD